MKLMHILPVGIVAVLAAVFGYYLLQVSGGKDISTVPSVLIDKPVPALDLPPIEGVADGFNSADLKGKVTVLNVWASWCIPCRAEHPQLMDLKKDGVAVYGINYKDKPKDAKAFLNELGNPFVRIGADPHGRASIDLGVYGYPETFLIDAEGRIRYKHVGAITVHDLAEKIRPLIKEIGG